MKQRYICCAYISTNSKIYNILHLLWSQDLKVNLFGLQQDIRSDGVK